MSDDYWNGLYENDVDSREQDGSVYDEELN